MRWLIALTGFWGLVALGVPEPIVTPLHFTDHLHHGGERTRSVAISGDGLHYAAAGMDRWVTVWNAKTAESVHRFRSPVPLGSLHFLDGGSEILGMGHMGFYRYDLRRKEGVGPYPEQAFYGRISYSHLSKDRTHLAFSYSVQMGPEQQFGPLRNQILKHEQVEKENPETVYVTEVWDTREEKMACRIPGKFASGWLSAHGGVLLVQSAVPEGEALPAKIETYDVSTGSKVSEQAMDVPEVGDYKMFFSPSGKQVALLRSTEEDPTSILLVDVASGKVIREIERGHEISWVRFFPDEQRMMVKDLSVPTVEIIDLNDAEKTVSFPVFDEGWPQRTISSDGNWILMGEVGACARVVNAQTGLPRWSTRYMVELPKPRFSPDGRYLLGGLVHDGAITLGLYDVELKKAPQVIAVKNVSRIRPLFEHEGQFYTGRSTNNWKRLDLEKGKLRKAELPPGLKVPPVAKVSEPQAGGAGGGVLRVMDAGTGNVLYEREATAGGASQWRVSPDGRSLIERKFKAADRVRFMVQTEYNYYEASGAGRLLTRFEHNQRLRYSGDGLSFMQVSTNTLHMFDAENGLELYHLPRSLRSEPLAAGREEQTKYVGFCDNGRYILSVHRQRDAEKVEGTSRHAVSYLRFCDAISGKVVANYELPARGIGSVVANPAQPSGVVIYKNGEVELWRLPELEQVEGAFDREQGWQWLKNGTVEQVRSALHDFRRFPGEGLRMFAQAMQDQEKALVHGDETLARAVQQIDSRVFRERVAAAKHLLESPMPRKRAYLNRHLARQELTSEQRAGIRRVLERMETDPPDEEKRRIIRLAWALRGSDSAEAGKRVKAWDQKVGRRP